MLFNSVTFAAIAAFIHGAAAVYTGSVLPPSEVPFQGAGIYSSNDSSIANFTVQYKTPFSTDYGGYYTWAVDNTTFAIANFTGYDTVDGYNVPDGLHKKFPYFTVNEGTPKKINTTATHTESNKKFQKILHIVFENEVYNWTMSDPWWQHLATKGKLLTNSHGVTHPSLSNYVALLAGETFGIANEDFYNVNTTSVYDLLDAAKVDYGTYVEWYSPEATDRGPNDCNNYIFNGPIDNTNPDWSSQIYRRLDVPALLFSTYTSNYDRCSKIYNATANFASDVKSGSLPKYSYYVPDLLHNGHDPESNSDYDHQSTTSGMWLSSFLDFYLPSLIEQGTLVVATWDEATWQNDNDNVPNNDNHVATILFGAGVTPNSKDDTYITHYGVLRGAIENFNLGSLGRNDTNTTNGNLYDLVW